ncbi:mitochondrial large subunit ribosomal protein-domain-containing protein [Cadophora sp. MPI-SDFR-AT-0126]|nr:mitochondrial large subunit ribosomal protein-domain-containing protein [Leotiomycetes sp. MPI-SDFR-AT-0126]
MASALPLPFLRPMSLPRPSTLHKYLKLTRPALSQSTTLRKASTTTTSASTSSSPLTTPLTPSTSTQTRTQTPTSSATSSSSPARPPPSKPYRLIRTPSNKLPIYLLWKRGGNKKLTRVRKIEGDVNVLKTDLQVALGVKEGDVTVNQLARQVIVKGHMKPQIEQFFKDLQQ